MLKVVNTDTDRWFNETPDRSTNQFGVVNDLNLDGLAQRWYCCQIFGPQIHSIMGALMEVQVSVNAKYRCA